MAARTNSSGEGAGHSLAAEMRAFDSLPPAAREAIREAPANFSVAALVRNPLFQDQKRALKIEEFCDWLRSELYRLYQKKF